MTREEQIYNASENHRDIVCCGFIDPIADSQQESFALGAKWADEHPQNGLINIEKACDWLKNILYIHSEFVEDKHWGTTTRYDYITSDHDSIEDLIKDFRKAMEV